MIPHFNMTKIRGKLRTQEKAVAAGPRLVRVVPLGALKTVCPVVEHLERKRKWRVIEVPGFGMGISGNHRNYAEWWSRMKRVDQGLLIGKPPLTENINQYIPKGNPSNVYTTIMPYKLFDEMLKNMDSGLTIPMSWGPNLHGKKASGRTIKGSTTVPWFVGKRESHYGSDSYPLRHVDGKGVKNVHQLNPRLMWKTLPMPLSDNPIYMGWRSTDLPGEDHGQNVSVMLFTDYHLNYGLYRDIEKGGRHHPPG